MHCCLHLKGDKVGARGNRFTFFAASGLGIHFKASGASSWTTVASWNVKGERFVAESAGAAISNVRSYAIKMVFDLRQPF